MLWALPVVVPCEGRHHVMHSSAMVMLESPLIFASSTLVHADYGHDCDHDRVSFCSALPIGLRDARGNRSLGFADLRLGNKAFALLSGTHALDKSKSSQ